MEAGERQDDQLPTSQCSSSQATGISSIHGPKQTLVSLLWLWNDPASFKKNTHYEGPEISTSTSQNAHDDKSDDKSLKRPVIPSGQVPRMLGL